LTNQIIYDTIIIGGGASGIFAGISCKTHFPNSSVLVLEKSTKLLSKVKISGGGRCNVTHSCFEIKELILNYPRGSKELRNVFSSFDASDTIQWFESRGVPLKTESDGRIFPTSDISQTIIDCLLKECQKLDIEILLKHQVENISKNNVGIFVLNVNKNQSFYGMNVIIATGGYPKLTSYHWIEHLGIKIIEPVPSLFSFNAVKSPLAGLEGLSFDASFSIKGIRLNITGPAIITHWGISGPAPLKLSAWAALELYIKKYEYELNIHFCPQWNQSEIQNELMNFKSTNGKSKINKANPFKIPNRLYERLLIISGIDIQKNWGDVNKKEIATLVLNITQFKIQCSGKTTYKEEFVTAGGIDLKEINLSTMESKKTQGLFFTGELLNIDGVTGGFNFQNAWSTGWIAGSNIRI
jgi:predicted Rossmann fold flavoprotein